MTVYLPIAEIPVNIMLIAMLGAGVGFLSGVFGVGGGFLMTPLLILNGIPPAVAVGTEASQISASSLSGALAHFRRGGVDVRMGLILVLGGLMGTLVGVFLLQALLATGRLEPFVQVAYVVLLGGVGLLMLTETARAQGWLPRRRSRKARVHHTWLQKLPPRVRFPHSRLYASALPPVALGFVVGVLAAALGVGGGFIMVPAMIYILRMPPRVVVGTSLFQIVFVAGAATVLHAAINGTVDILLALILIVGGVIGAQIGVKVGRRLKAEHMRLALALLVLLVGARLGVDLVREPTDIFVVREVGA
jgi:hypothetical protein